MTQYLDKNMAVRARSSRDVRDRLTEKAHTNVIEIGRLAQQLTKSSRSHEILSSSTKTFVNQEGTIANSNEQLKQLSNFVAGMNPQFSEIKRSMQTVSKITEQLDLVQS